MMVWLRKQYQTLGVATPGLGVLLCCWSLAVLTVLSQLSGLNVQWLISLARENPPALLNSPDDFADFFGRQLGTPRPRSEAVSA